jgi:hypothetical protein
MRIASRIVDRRQQTRHKRRSTTQLTTTSCKYMQP